jgi:hypothetical protein
LKRRAYGTAKGKVLAYLCKGIASGIAVDDIRKWITSPLGEGAYRAGDDGAPIRHGVDVQAGNPDSGAAVRAGHQLLDLVHNSVTWKELCKAAEREVDSSTSRGEIASRLYAALFLPFPPPGPGKKPPRSDRVVSMRLTLALIGGRMLRDGLIVDTAIVTQPALAALAGCNPETIGRSMSDLVGMKVLAALNASRSKGRFKLPAMTKGKAAQIRGLAGSWQSFDTDAPDAIASVILSARHPAWGYSSALSHLHWLVLLADTARIPVEQLGLSREMEKRARPVLDGFYLIPANVRRSLTQILDDIADDPQHARVDPVTGEAVTARAGQDAALVEYARTSEIRKGVEISHKTHKKALWDILNSEDYAFPRMPRRRSDADDSDAARKELDQQIVDLLDRMQAAILACDLPAAMCETGKAVLTRRLVNAGWGPRTSEDAAHFVLREPAGVTAKPYLVEAKRLRDNPETAIRDRAAAFLS